MQHLIVGSLLAIIIILAGWLIAFNNKMLNKKTLIDDNLRVLNLQIQKKKELNKQGGDSLKSGEFAEIIISKEELDEMIAKYCISYNEGVKKYNRILAQFPNNIAGKILGIKELSFFQRKDIF